MQDSARRSLASECAKLAEPHDFQFAQYLARLASDSSDCSRCGKSLEDEVSKAAGLGPECRSMERDRHLRESIAAAAIELLDLVQGGEPIQAAHRRALEGLRARGARKGRRDARAKLRKLSAELRKRRKLE